MSVEAEPAAESPEDELKLVARCQNGDSAAFNELVTRYRDGDAAGAREIEAELRPVIDALAIDSNPIPVKAAMAIAGHDVGIPRLPLVDATEAQKAELRAVLERAGVLQAAQV